LIRDGETGRLFKAGDAAALSEAISHMLANREQWERIRLAGRAFVEKERTWASSAANYVSVYGGVLPAHGVAVNTAS
jgi:glycosyltransferase involved in cell wall biosynthesis